MRYDSGAGGGRQVGEKKKKKNNKRQDPEGKTKPKASTGR